MHSIIAVFALIGALYVKSKFMKLVYFAWALLCLTQALELLTKVAWPAEIIGHVAGILGIVMIVMLFRKKCRLSDL